MRTVSFVLAVLALLSVNVCNAIVTTSQYVVTKFDISACVHEWDGLNWPPNFWASMLASPYQKPWYEQEDNIEYSYVCFVDAEPRFRYGDLAGYISNAIFHIARARDKELSFTGIKGYHLLNTNTLEQALAVTRLVGIYRHDGKLMGTMKKQKTRRTLPFSFSRMFRQIGVDEDVSEEMSTQVLLFGPRNERIALEPGGFRGSIDALYHRVVGDDIYLYWSTISDANNNANNNANRERVFDTMSVRYGVLSGKTWQWLITPTTIFTRGNLGKLRDEFNTFLSISQAGSNIHGSVANDYNHEGRRMWQFTYDIATSSSIVSGIVFTNTLYACLVDNKARVHVLTQRFCSDNDGSWYHCVSGTNTTTLDVTKRLATVGMQYPGVQKIILDENDRPFLLYSREHVIGTRKYLAFEAMPLFD